MSSTMHIFLFRILVKRKTVELNKLYDNIGWVFVTDTVPTLELPETVTLPSHQNCHNKLGLLC